MFRMRSQAGEERGVDTGNDNDKLVCSEWDKGKLMGYGRPLTQPGVRRVPREERDLKIK